MQALNILIIEDDLLTAADLTKNLEKAGGHKITTARSCKEALAAVRRTPPDIVLLDIGLDGPQDGISTAKEILSFRQMPIIVLTGNTDDATYKRALETFVPAGYLTKPFRQIDLPRIVELAWQNFRPENLSPDSAAMTDGVFLPVEKGFEKIIKSEVVYITTQKGTHCSYIHEAYKKTPRLIHLSMGYLENYFASPQFYRLSRSLIVNLNYIERIEGLQITLQDFHPVLNIPETGRADLLRRLSIVHGPKKGMT
jgi:DNA-binding LytR/AlgR family response regulator